MRSSPNCNSQQEVLPMNGLKKLTAMSVAVWFFAQLTGTALSAESLDEIHKKALKEGGTLNFYGTLAQINAERILPVFEKQFPGIKINHVDATSDKLVARAVTEARGGRTLGDVLQIPLENVVQAHDQKLLLETNLPEAAAFPDGAKGSYWIASDLQFFAAACLTCYSHHYPRRIKKGAPLNYMLTEGVASINGTAIFKDAPHPNTAMLFARWIASLEGQKVMAQGGRTPAHPKVEPVDKTRTEKVYFISASDLKEFPKYEKSWKEIFNLR